MKAFTGITLHLSTFRISAIVTMDARNWTVGVYKWKFRQAFTLHLLFVEVHFYY